MDRVAKKPAAGRGKKRLHIFDFDHTLFHSPGPGPELSGKEREDFWHDPTSLSNESVPETPNDNWYIRRVVEEFRRAKKDPDAYVAVVTGRSEPLRGNVEELLSHMGLEPDKLVLKPKKTDDTAKYKIREMRHILDENPDVQKIHFYEDREDHLREFQEAAEAEGYDFVPHYIADSDADRSWDEFMWLLYEGGAKKVPNTNTNTRKRYPKVRADYLLKNDPDFAARVRRQFRTWVSTGKPKGRRQVERTATSRKVLCFTLDLTVDAVTRRVARRFLLAPAR